MFRTTLITIGFYWLTVSPFLSGQTPGPHDTVVADQALARYFEAETQKLSNACLSDFKSLDDWKDQKAELRQQLLEMLGLSPFPEKTDLKVKITGTTEHQDFIVQKLHYQSRPGLYVTGNLYLPKKRPGQLPAILYVCGHGKVKKNGTSYGNKVHYHHHGSWFAQNGYICLTIDTLQLGEIEGIHHGTYREKMWWWMNRGYTPAGVEAWNCVRALDLLQSLPEVDGNKLGVTGRSGGGAYSWWIAAIDERIQCAVPVAGITDLENHVVDGCIEGHCDCMFMVNTYQWDYPMVAALVAPRPLLISNTDRDRIFPLDGVYRTYQKVKQIYALHGAAQKVALHITAGPHQDTQELRVHAFRWLNAHLKNEESLIDQPAEKLFQPEQLKVFDKLPPDQRNTVIHETFVKTKPVPLPATLKGWQNLYPKIQNELMEKCFRGLPKQHSQLKLTRGQSSDLKGLGIKQTHYFFESQPHVRLKLSFLSTQDLSEINEFLVLILGDPDEDLSWSSESDRRHRELEKLLTRLPRTKQGKAQSVADYLQTSGQAIVFVTPRGVGENRWNPNERFQTQTQRRFYLLGQTADAMRVYDIRRAVAAIQEIHPKGTPAIWLNARGSMAINAVYATLFDLPVQRLDLFQPTSTHRQGPYYLNVRRVLEIPQAIAIAAEKATIKIQTNNPTDYSFAQTTSRLGNRDPKVEFVKSP
ncbi:MAG: acetylxylan esterase [Planctomycetota bacterium]|nr:acetylxylan esterase [Planctomycetota bacterium]